MSDSGVVASVSQFLGDLAVRQIQAHDVEAQHPDPQRLVMSGQHGAGQPEGRGTPITAADYERSMIQRRLLVSDDPLMQKVLQNT